jgi:hypothetical protein
LIDCTEADDVWVAAAIAPGGAEVRSTIPEVIEAVVTLRTEALLWLSVLEKAIDYIHS